MTMIQAFQNAATRTIQVKDTRMVYRELGERGGVPVVFLHHLTAVRAWPIECWVWGRRFFW
jgi:hypothetical protein